MIRLRTPFLAAALLTSVAAVGLTPALAQTAPEPANSTAARSEAHHHARMTPEQFVDGRIALWKTELKITPGQEKQWQEVEAAMRENAKAFDQAIAAARQNRTGTDAVQRLELREQFAKVRADNDARLLAAFKPLYASLSPNQQQVANQLVAARHHHWHHRA